MSGWGNWGNGEKEAWMRPSLFLWGLAKGGWGRKRGQWGKGAKINLKIGRL